MSAGLLANEGASVPAISRFFGVKIQMHWSEHPPPHFHATYGDHRAKYSIGSLELVAGTLPRRAQALVLEWAMIRRPELGENWARVERREPLLPIAGLDEED